MVAHNNLEDNNGEEEEETPDAIESEGPHWRVSDEHPEWDGDNTQDADDAAKPHVHAVVPGSVGTPLIMSVDDVVNDSGENWKRRVEQLKS